MLRRQEQEQEPHYDAWGNEIEERGPLKELLQRLDSPLQPLLEKPIAPPAPFAPGDIVSSESRQVFVIGQMKRARDTPYEARADSPDEWLFSEANDPDYVHWRAKYFRLSSKEELEDARDVSPCGCGGW